LAETGGSGGDHPVVQRLPIAKYSRSYLVALFLMLAAVGVAQTIQNYTDLHGFGGGVTNAGGRSGSDGNLPWGGVTFDAAGDKAGTSRMGGAYGYGMVWEIPQSGTYHDIHDFNGTVLNSDGRSGPDGRHPYAGVTFDSDGDMFGTAFDGGPNTIIYKNGAGMIWEITNAGKYIDLHDFGGAVLNANGQGGQDGRYPTSGVTFDNAGNMFGTASEGGAHGSNGGKDVGGIVWEISNSGVYSDIYDFGTMSSTVFDGYSPFAGVTFDGEGNMFGTTTLGGARGGGIAWELTNFGTYVDLHDFGGTELSAHGATVPDGATPYAGVAFDSAGDMVGTTLDGGAYGGGIVWSIPKNGVFSDIHDFKGSVVNAGGQNGPDGFSPYAGGTFDSAGNLFGTVAGGGLHDGGLVWEISKAGIYKDLHDFGGNSLNIFGNTGTDGVASFAGVAINSEGDLVGTANEGGPDNNGGMLWKLILDTDSVNFIDTFQRGNTLPGTLGIAPDGDPYTMLGAYVNTFPLPPATDGELHNEMFVATKDAAVIYATKYFNLPIHHISATVQWDKSASHPSTETGAMIISPNSDLIETMVHITFNSEEVLLQKRNGAVSGDPFVTLIAVPVRQLDGKSHSISVDVVGTTATLTVDGTAQSYTDADFPSLVGPYVSWEIYSATSDVYPIQYTGVAASS
jgi:hypothetical protein